MHRDQQIRLNQLLLAREAEFVRVHELERKIDALLGEPYPLSRPPLPSDGRRKGKAATARPAAAAGEHLRRLEAGEAAYRVTYRHLGRSATEEHDDFAALQTLLASQGAALQVLRLETIDAAGARQSLLFAAE